MYTKESEKYTELFQKIKHKFGSVKTELWLSISDMSYDVDLDDNIITVLLHPMPSYIEYDGLNVMCSRKFFMKRGWVYDKKYRLIQPDKCEFSLPYGIKPLVVGELLSVYGQDGTQDFSNVKTIYFVCDNHNTVESWIGSSVQIPTDNNVYSASFSNDILKSIKTHNYTQKNKLLPNWKELWNYKFT